MRGFNGGSHDLCGNTTRMGRSSALSPSPSPNPPLRPDVWHLVELREHGHLINECCHDCSGDDDDLDDDLDDDDDEENDDDLDDEDDAHQAA